MNDLTSILKNNVKSIEKLPPEEQRQILALVEELEEAKTREEARKSFLPFVNSFNFIITQNAMFFDILLEKKK